MKLPYANNISKEQIEEKLVTYILKEDHKDGKHKARLFKAKLGINLSNKDILIKVLIKIAKEEQICTFENSFYGEKYVIDFILTTTYGSSKVRSAWIIRHNEYYPRLTNVYPID